MNILGISAGFHDAALTVVDNYGNIVFAGHSERYSGVKNDAHINRDIIMDALRDGRHIDTIAYYERPWLKQLRQWRSGQGIEWDRLTIGQVLKQELGHTLYYGGMDVQCYNHHLCHAAAGFQTSTFNRATVVVIDAIGEFDTVSIYAAEYRNGRAEYKRLWHQTYPHSIGLFYSAFTERVGLKPMEDEYILMGMSAYGRPQFASAILNNFIESIPDTRFKENLHTGVDKDYLDYVDDMDIAASVQALLEELVYAVMSRARDFGFSDNLVYMGGVALNCLANRNLGKYFDNIWIMPCPGDAGSSLGAAALAHGGRIHWRNAYLGHDIPGPYPVNDILDGLVRDKIVGVASGRAEFGPRALGNRSLLADPRGPDIKDRVNEIKRRQKFRPFAPVILEEYAEEYFGMPRGWCDSRYMQIVGNCGFPEQFPAICHVDGTSRIQTVPRDGSGIRELLEKWFVVTGCPMLLNTSLNIKGEPMVNDREDADRFEQQYGIRVYS